MACKFADSLAEFREFLQQSKYPQRVIWIEPENLLLTGQRLFYIRVASPEDNEQRVKELFDLSQRTDSGILFETVCTVDDTTYAKAWVPKDDQDRQYRFMAKGLKLSVKTDKVPTKIVRSRFQWAYLQWALRDKQQNKSLLFY